MNGNNESDLSIKLFAVRRLYKEKKIDEKTYADAVMKLIGVKP